MGNKAKQQPWTAAPWLVGEEQRSPLRRTCLWHSHQHWVSGHLTLARPGQGDTQWDQSLEGGEDNQAIHMLLDKANDISPVWH